MRTDRLLIASSALAAALLLAGCSTDDNPTAPGVPLSAVVIAPATDTLQVGATATFTATAYDTLGHPVGAGFTWASSDPAVFTVSAAGHVTAKSEGSAKLFVEAGGKRDTATVFVYPQAGWVLQPNPSGGQTLNGVFFMPDGRRGWAVGNAGRVMRTLDAGANWTFSPGGTTSNLRSVWFTSSSIGWAVGYGGTIMRSTNGGGGWTRQNQVPVADNLQDVWFANADTGWVAGNNGLVLRTVDGGSTWETHRLPVGFALRSVSFSGTQDGWAVGDGGTIAGTHDGGVTWFVTPSLTSQPLTAVWRTDFGNAVAVGAQGTVLRTVTTADSVVWTVTAGAGANNALEGVCFPVALTGYASGTNALTGAAMLRSDDGAQLWQVQLPQTTASLHDVFFVDTQRGWAVGDQGVIVHTATGGR
jgi:photosystem II stability/assembly factor-like uncharacterized protein